MELETHYSLRCLLNAQSGLRSTAAELAKLRRRLDKMLREKGMETARPVHDSIVRGKEKLCSLLNGSRLSLLEIGQEELASASQKLVCSVRHFPIMAPDYTPMLRRVGPSGESCQDWVLSHRSGTCGIFIASTGISREF